MRIVSFLILMLLPALLQAQAGALDSSFNDDGKALLCLDTNTLVNQSLVQSDGKIIVSGLKDNNTSFVCRVTTDGSLDGSFGNGGYFELSTNGTSEVNSLSYGSALQSDGKIILVGNFTSFLGDSNFMAIRLDTNGVLDGSFGVNGKVNLDLGTLYDYAYAIKVQPDGSIIIGGSTGGVSGGFCLIRLTSTGILDSAFGTNGVVITIVSPGNESAIKSLDLLPNGKIVVVGNRTNGSQNIVLVQYEQNGSIDNAFGINGKVETIIQNGVSDEARNIKLLSNGKLLVQGIFNIFGPIEDGGNVLLQYTSNGALDPTFGIGGISINNGAYSGYGLAIQTDQKIIVSGAAAGEFIVARYLSNGSYDNTFNGNGKVITSILDGHVCFSSTVVLTLDHKIVAAGFSNNNDDSKGCIGLIRIHPGTLDNEEFDNLKLKLYPNPTTDIVFVNLQDPMDYRVYNMLGVKVVDGQLMNNTQGVDVTNLAGGYYIIQLNASNGITQMLRFLKE